MSAKTTTAKSNTAKQKLSPFMKYLLPKAQVIALAKNVERLQAELIKAAEASCATEVEGKGIRRDSPEYVAYVKADLDYRAARKLHDAAFTFGYEVVSEGGAK